eukprot:10685083-Ditylum_brightwellii.AAC.1
MWQDTMTLEVDALKEIECFDFQDAGNKPAGNYQLTTLLMVFDCKQDIRRKARIVAGRNLIDLLDNEVYFSNVKGISVKLLHVIAHCVGLNALCGDIGNAYVNVYATEKVCTVAGPEFGEVLVGKTVVIRKALYGLATSFACFHDHFSNPMRAMDFLPTRFDRDVWIELSKDGKPYEYICMHVYDFCIFSVAPDDVIKQIQAIHTVKSVGPPNYYLGNNFKRDSKRHWNMGCKNI